MESDATRRNRRHLAVSMRYLRMLNDAVATIMDKVQGQTDALLRILTPEQNVIFLSWMEDNRATMRARGLEKILPGLQGGSTPVLTGLAGDAAALGGLSALPQPVGGGVAGGGNMSAHVAVDTLRAAHEVRGRYIYSAWWIVTRGRPAFNPACH